MPFSPSLQQADFLEWISAGSGSCVLEAVAGAGKTTTLIEAIERTGGGVAFLAYNKKIADEIKGKLQRRGIDWKTAEAGTIHSFGFRAYRKAFPQVKVDANKLADLAAVQLNSAKHPALGTLCQLVSLAKQRALGVMGSIDDHSLWYDIIQHFDVQIGDVAGEDDDAAEAFVKAGIELLRRSNAVTDIIDFDDMVYLPLVKKVPTATTAATATTAKMTMPKASSIRTVWGMWRRLRRRTMAPRRPAVFPDQWGLVLVTAIVIAGGIAVAYAVLSG